MGKKKKWFMPLILFLVVGAAYANSLSSGFVWDDHPLIIGKQEFFNHPGSAITLLVSPDAALTARQAPPYYRPLDTLSYMLDHYLWGLNPFWYHLENLLLHALVAMLFYLLLLEVFGDIRLAFIASVFFAVYPVNAEAVDFISARNTLLCAAFTMASLLFLAKDGRKWTALSLVAYLLALFSKEPAVVLPFFFISLGLTAGRPFGKRELKLKKGVLGGFFAVTAVYFMIRHLVLGAFIAKHGISLSFSRLKLIAAVFFEHFRLFVFPFKLNALYTRQAISFAPFKAAAVIPVVLLLVYLSLDKKTPDPVRAGAQWIFWGLLPVSNIVKIPSAPVAERFQYTIIFGFVLILAYLLAGLAQKKAALGITVITVLFIALGIRTFERNLVWRDDLTLYSSMIRSDPADAVAYYNLGNVYGKSGYLGDAVKDFKMALSINPFYIKPRVNLGVAYAKEGNLEEAVTEFRKALALKPGHVMAMLNLGMAYLKMGLVPEAVKEFNQAVRLAPGFPDAHLALGVGYEKEGLFRGAADEFEIVLELDPGNGQAIEKLNYVRGLIQ